MHVREALIDAAIRVFSEAGLRGATTRRIAQEADVNEVTLFRHFKSKDDLITAALEQFATLAQVHPDIRQNLASLRSGVVERTTVGRHCEHPAGFGAGYGFTDTWHDWTP